MLAGGIPPALALMALSSVLPKIDAALAHNAHDSFLVKQLVGAVGLAMVVGAPLAGVLVNRIGVRIILIAALLVFTIFGTAGLYVSDLSLLLMTRLGVGISAAAIQIMSMTLINTRFDEQERARWMGRHIAAAMLATILVHPIIGALGELSWRWPFVIYFVGLFLLPAAIRAQTITSAQSNKHKRHRAASFSSLLANLPWRYLLLAMILGGIAYLPMVYTPYLLRQSGINSSTLMSLVLTFDSLAGVCMALNFGRARRHLSHYGVLAVSLFFAGVGVSIAVLSSGTLGIVVGMFVFGLGVGWFVPNLMTALAVRVAAVHQAGALGLVKAAHFLSAPLFISLAEPITRAYGPTGVMALIAVLILGLFGVAGVRGLRRGFFSVSELSAPQAYSVESPSR